jgi:transcriptional regulator with XRE-family HTH domain
VTQIQLAERADLDRSFISDMERAVKEPTIQTLDAIALAFNISISELMKGV